MGNLALGKQPAVCRRVKNRITYNMIGEVKCFSIGMALMTYGLEAVDSEGTICLRIPDISTDKAFVSRFINKCNYGKVSLLHVRDVLDDWLALV